MQTPRSRKSIRLRAKLILLGIGLSLAIGVAELAARLWIREGSMVGVCGVQQQKQLGWELPTGRCTYQTFEFTETYEIDQQHLVLGDPPLGAGTCKVLALGDSHTRAVGVDGLAAWPNQLQRKLGAEGCTVVNGGVPGYSLSQELVRFRALQDSLRPDLVVVGFSLATDMFDSRGPDRGGFLYFEQYGRSYFSVVEGQLQERHELEGKLITPELRSVAVQSPSLLYRVKGWLDVHSRLFFVLKRSRLGAWFAGKFAGGKPVWEALEYLSASESPEAAADWQMVELLLRQMRDEVRAAGAELLVLAIPYTPQVYDEIWSAVQNDQLSRYRSTERLSSIARALGIDMVDATMNMQQQVRQTGRWLHYRYDGHPTAEGHVVLAETAAVPIRRWLQTRNATSQ